MSSLPDPIPVLRQHLEAVQLSDEEKADIEATFRSLAKLLGKKVMGEDVEDQLKQVQAQALLWKSGALASVYSAFWAAAEEYAQRVGAVLLSVVKGMI